MEDLNSLLKHKAPKEPEEVAKLRLFAKDNYNVSIKVRVTRHTFIISAPNAAVAGRMRIDTGRMIKECAITKRLFIKIAV